ncbi:MAG: ParM/StbA family protein [Nitrospirae bacterium]|nr:ParM/StbA family protein [Nitrospirota bacterium]
MKIGIDVGYGYTKVVTKHSSLFFPSRVGPARELSFTLKEGADVCGETVEYQGEQFFVGDKARHSDVTYTLRTRGWVESKMYGALLTSAITRALNGRHATTDPEAVTIVTGLPVDYMRDKPKAEEVIRKTCDGIGINIADISVIPQPFGSFFDIFYDNDGDIAGSAPLFKRLGIVDIGYHTTDYILIEDAKHYVEKASGSIPTGAYELYDIVARELKNAFDRDMVTADEAEQSVKTKHFKVSGQNKDVSNLVERVLSQVGQKIAGVIKSKWSIVGEIDVVLLTGGGGSLLQQHISAMAHTHLLISEPQMANARGYYKRSVILERRMMR